MLRIPVHRRRIAVATPELCFLAFNLLYASFKYVEKFSMLVLEVPRMDEEDKLHYFMEGLQIWAQNEIQRQGFHDI
ncbi:unnamed protein product [Spirodela intermedia]|uniref:Uncharacterized protein n=1 Tax=Spirodela intermedia TaxID=51605 RepID=A0A7I8LK12_SPIIN|nr:unnamed protein product [Spirodela intermedia]